MYNKEQDTFYARVWNTGLKRFDDLLEKQIEEKEQVKWRERWSSGSLKFLSEYTATVLRETEKQTLIRS